MVFLNNETGIYRAAISLNNIACRLQERCCDRQALLTFQDALDFMKAISSSSANPTKILPSPQDAEMKLHNAAERLARPCPTKIKQGSYRQGLTIATTGDDSDCLETIQTVSIYSYRPTAVLIRIEEYGCPTLTLRDVELDSTIILSNFGLSYFFLSSSMAESPTADIENLRRNSINILKLAQKLLLLRMEDYDEFSDGDEELLEKVICASLIVTKGLSQVYLTTEKSEWKVKGCFERLADLKEAASHFGFLSLAPCSPSQQQNHCSKRFAPAA